MWAGLKRALPARYFCSMCILSGFSMAEIAALRQPSGAPYLEFTGKAARFMAQNHLQAHLSLTHEAGLAGAFVVLERVE